MKPAQLLRAILPDVLIDNFDIVNFDKSADRFDIYLDEKKVQLKEDKINPDIISYGFGEYRTIQDYPIVLVSIVQSKTILFVVAPLISMFVNVNGLTNLPMKSSVMIGIYPNLTVHGSILSSSLF